MDNGIVLENPKLRTTTEWCTWLVYSEPSLWCVYQTMVGVFAATLVTGRRATLKSVLMRDLMHDVVCMLDCYAMVI